MVSYLSILFFIKTRSRVNTKHLKYVYLGPEETLPIIIASDLNPKQEEEAAVLRVHAALLADWEAVQKDIQVLREELKEDKWLTVFRTVTDQADGMMSSLEKAVNRCQVRTGQGYLWPAIN